MFGGDLIALVRRARDKQQVSMFLLTNSYLVIYLVCFEKIQNNKQIGLYCIITAVINNGLKDGEITNLLEDGRRGEGG